MRPIPRMASRRALTFVVLFSLLAVTQPNAALSGSTTHTLPARISDGEFWRMVTEFSEGDGYFASDNLVSNELTFQWGDSAAAGVVDAGSGLSWCGT